MIATLLTIDSKHIEGNFEVKTETSHYFHDVSEAKHMLRTLMGIVDWTIVREIAIHYPDGRVDRRSRAE